MDTSISSAVFIPDEDFVWIRGKVIREINAGTIEVLITDEEYLNRKSSSKKIVNLKALNLSALPLQNDDAEGGVEDMTTLNYLHEASILYNLQIRFQQSAPYTYTGAICVAVSVFFYFLDYLDFDVDVIYWQG
jgi:myosin-5